MSFACRLFLERLFREQVANHVEVDWLNKLFEEEQNCRGRANGITKLLFVGLHGFRFVRLKSSGEESPGRLSSMMIASKLLKFRSIQISERISVFWSQNTKWQRAKEKLIPSQIQNGKTLRLLVLSR